MSPRRPGDPRLPHPVAHVSPPPLAEPRWRQPSPWPCRDPAQASSPHRARRTIAFGSPPQPRAKPEILAPQPKPRHAQDHLLQEPPIYSLPREPDRTGAAIMACGQQSTLWTTTCQASQPGPWTPGTCWCHLQSSARSSPTHKSSHWTLRTVGPIPAPGHSATRCYPNCRQVCPSPPDQRLDTRNQRCQLAFRQVRLSPPSQHLDSLSTWTVEPGGATRPPSGPPQPTYPAPGQSDPAVPSQPALVSPPSQRLDSRTRWCQVLDGVDLFCVGGRHP
ncbi:hypothetical protein LV75_000514 [Actinokineospora diospyrosa]|uniref:Uncharacterized protein n=1 Tax=Actinokineospora diospyrosa TaxID=103728 RepID=A0ABT1I5X9_9PSEU|nr:hypothetical protein [Actinokineospora diospyrosa]